VVVAVVSMRMMEAAVDEVVDVVAMGNCFVPAARAMNMTGLVALVAVFWRAVIRVGRADFDRMLVDMILVGMMQMAVMQVIHVIPVAYCGVAAAGPVLMGMISVSLTSMV